MVVQLRRCPNVGTERSKEDQLMKSSRVRVIRSNLRYQDVGENTSQMTEITDMICRLSKLKSDLQVQLPVHLS